MRRPLRAKWIVCTLLAAWASALSLVGLVGGCGSGSESGGSVGTDASPDGTSQTDGAAPDVAADSATDTTVSNADVILPDANELSEAEATAADVPDATPPGPDVDADGAPPVDADGGADTIDVDSEPPDTGPDRDAPVDEENPDVADGTDGADEDALGPTAQALENRSSACQSCGEACVDEGPYTCDAFTGEELTRCLDLLACALENGCGVTEMSPSCLCGTADPSGCAAGTTAPTGPCKTYYFADFDSGVPGILSDFQDTDLPTGMANALVSCLQPPECPSCF
jgi:hypothetical protein